MKYAGGNNMANLVKVKLNETEIWMEVKEPTGRSDGAPRLVSAEKIAGQTLEIAETLHATIRAYCTSLVQSFDAMPASVKPHKVTAEFGLTLSGDLKFYVVNIAGNASLKISAEWQLK